MVPGSSLKEWFRCEEMTGKMGDVCFVKIGRVITCLNGWFELCT